MSFDLARNTPQYLSKFHIDTLTFLGQNWVEIFPSFSVIILLRKQLKIT